MFVLYEMQGDDGVAPTLITSSCTRLFMRVSKLVAGQKTFSAVRVERGRPDITVAQGFESSQGYQSRERVDV